MEEIQVINARVKNLIQTENEWLISDPVILNGEVAYVKFGNFINTKVGDGIKKFSQLDYNLKTPQPAGSITPLTVLGPQTTPQFWFGERGVYPNAGNVEIVGDIGMVVWNGSNFSAANVNIDLVGYPKNEDAVLKNPILEELNREIGPQLAAGNQDDAGGVDFYKTNTLCVSKINGRISTAVCYIGATGTLYLSIIKPYDGGVILIKTLPVFNAPQLGYYGFTVNEDIKIGEALVVGGGSGTAKIVFATTGASGENQLVQYPRSGSPTMLPAGSYYSLFYNIRKYSDSGLESYISKDNIAKDLAEYALGENVSKNSISLGYRGGYDNTLFITDQQIITTDHIAPFNCIVPTVVVNMEQAGNLTFSVGLIDQYGYWVEDRSFTRAVNIGVNTMDVNINLMKGQRIAFKAPIPAIRIKNGAGSYWKSQTVGFGAVLQKVTTGAMLFGYDVYEVFDMPFAKSAEFNEVKSDVKSLKDKSAIIRSTPSGLKFRLVCDDDGTNVRGEAIGSSVAVLGNSITKHPIIPDWWGTWGMAASERSKDFVHQLETKMKLTEPAATVDCMNIADWEQEEATFDYNKINTLISGKDYIVIRLGENVSDVSNYQTRIETLINHCKTVNPTASIVTTGNFWANPTKDNIMKAASVATNSQYIDFDGLDIPENKSYIGAIVKGDDGLDHVVNNQGVAIHPGDLGMLRIAERIYSALF